MELEEMKLRLQQQKITILNEIKETRRHLSEVLHTKLETKNAISRMEDTIIEIRKRIVILEKQIVEFENKQLNMESQKIKKRFQKATLNNQNMLLNAKEHVTQMLIRKGNRYQQMIDFGLMEVRLKQRVTHMENIIVNIEKQELEMDAHAIEIEKQKSEKGTRTF